MEFNIGFPRKIANFEVHFVWSGKKKRVEKEKNNPKGFCPISLNNTHVLSTSYTTRASMAANLKKKRLIKQQTKFHRSKNSLIQLFLKTEAVSSHCPKCHYFLSFLNICNTFISTWTCNKTVHIITNKITFYLFRYVHWIQ